MARHSSGDSCNMGEILFEELKAFHKENREDYKHLETILEDQKELLVSHSEQLIKLSQVIHGDGNKGLIDRINTIEKVQAEFAEKFANIETREKVRAAVLGVICALCSSVGGIITYILSVYLSMNK